MECPTGWQHHPTQLATFPPAPTLSVRSVDRSRERRESGKKKCRRPKLSRSFLQISRANTLRAAGYTTGSSSTTCRGKGESEEGGAEGGWVHG